MRDCQRNCTHSNVTVSTVSPKVVCKDLFSVKSEIFGKIVLSWNTSIDIEEPVNYILEKAAFSDDILHWEIVGKTGDKVMEISNLIPGTVYKFRISLVTICQSYQVPSATTEWIRVPELHDPVPALTDLGLMDLKADAKYLQAYVQWSNSSDLPCSYDIFWFPLTGEDFYDQRSFTQPEEGFPVELPYLNFGTNYSVEITPVDPTGRRNVETTKLSISTPCSYKKGSDFRNCHIGPPVNLTADWSSNGSEVILTWSAPEVFERLDSDITPYYYLTAWDKDALLVEPKWRGFIYGNVTEYRLEELFPNRTHLIQLKAVIESTSGKSAFVELLPSELYTYNQTEEMEGKNPLAYVIGLPTVFITILIVALIYWKFKSYFTKEKFQLDRLASVPVPLRPYFVPMRKIQLKEVLGQGAFGIVHKGQITNGKSVDIVAVKEFLEAYSEEAESKIFQEVELMQIVGRHDHIVSLIGFSKGIDRLYLLVEYCPLKDLLTHLKELRFQCGELGKSIYIGKQSTKISEQTTTFAGQSSLISEDQWNRFVLYMYQIADGMEHMAYHKLVHCDIAARNILMSSLEMVKISDFGMSRDIYQSKAYTFKATKRLPIRWMSLETLDNLVFTTWSDVWSFGVLAWEIATLGDHPYDHLANESILPALKMGIRLHKPETCPPELYDMMLTCWQREPRSRPTFKELKYKLERLLERRNYVQILPDE